MNAQDHSARFAHYEEVELEASELRTIPQPPIDSTSWLERLTMAGLATTACLVVILNLRWITMSIDGPDANQTPLLEEPWLLCTLVSMGVTLAIAALTVGSGSAEE